MTSDELRSLHHFLPVFHLQHFAGEFGQVWVRDKALPNRSFRQAPKNIAAEHQLYSPQSGDDPRSDEMERWFADQIDGPASPLVGRLASCAAMPAFSNTERATLSAYIASLELRTPKLRDIMLKYFQNGLDSDWLERSSDRGKLRTDIHEATGVFCSESTLDRFIRQFRVEVEKPLWLQFIGRNLDRAGARLHHMVWTVFAAPPGHEFVISDSVILKFSESFDNPVPSTPGWSGGMGWLVPMSPLRALAIAPENRYGFAEVTAPWMTAVNRRASADATRFVYSRSQMVPLSGHRSPVA